MAGDDAKRTAQTDSDGDAPAKTRWWRWIEWRALFTPRALLILLVASLVGHGVAFYWTRLHVRGDGTESPEAALGTFQFVGTGPQNSSVKSAEFDLHISLLPGVDRSARARLADVRYRVQESVEELLRRARGADFEDPGLEELKRQLQEQINTTLGMRAVDQVIVTDLRLERRDKLEPSNTGTDVAADHRSAVHSAGGPSG